MNRLHNWLWRCIGWLSFNRITIIDQHKLPTGGATLFVVSHRNGALDAAAYAKAVPHAIPMVSAQLHRLPLGRFLFRGIAVARTKDRARGIDTDNGQAMRQCLEVLKSHGQLLIMPEGSSSLGPRHLPYKRGAARIAKAALEAGIPLNIVPLAVHYEAATQWQSRVEVLVGDSIQPETSTLGDMHRLITAALESVTANFNNQEEQKRAERLAYATTLGSKQSYARALKHFEHNFPTKLGHIITDLEKLVADRHLLEHQGVPLFPITSSLAYLFYWLLLLPLICGFVLFNLPVLVAACVASRSLSDDTNVISFWRMTIGLPAALIWLIVIHSILLFLAMPVALTMYWAVTLLGIGFWYRFRKLTVAVGNWILHSDIRASLLPIYSRIQLY